MTLGLYNYHSFFEFILLKIFESYINQNVMIVELRHIFDVIFDDDDKPIGVERECQIFHKVLAEVQQKHPLFRCTIINQALKIIGKSHVDAMLAATFEAQKYTDLCVGFDIVCEEDTHDPIKTYVAQILRARKSSKTGLDVFMHAGESLLRDNNNLIDAILLDTKRIGHGYNLIQHPKLIKHVIEKDICIECCPISNRVLGQILDVRSHPARTFMQKGIAISLNSDDPGFWGYEGVTLDYVFAFIAWDLTLGELKQFCLNSLKYSSIKQADKDLHQVAFNENWAAFVQNVNDKY